MSDEIERGEMLLLAVSSMHRLQIEKLQQLEISLTLRQYRILQRIGQGHTSMSELSKLAHRALPTISESVDGLIRRKLLSRRTSVHDRRTGVLSLTPSGKKALALGTACLDRLAEGFFGELSISQQAVLEDLATRMYGYVGGLIWEDRRATID